MKFLCNSVIRISCYKNFETYNIINAIFYTLIFYNVINLNIKWILNSCCKSLFYNSNTIFFLKKKTFFWVEIIIVWSPYMGCAFNKELLFFYAIY